MKIQHVALTSTAAARAAGVPELTPEMLAAVGARYSRNNEGLSRILALIDKSDPEKSIDSIFRMVDYGHASIADMVPVAMFIDNVSLWLIYHVWSISPMAAGQESSTRYISYSDEARTSPDSGVVLPAHAGIRDSDLAEWYGLINSAFRHYKAATAYWHQVALKQPSTMRLPADLVRQAEADPTGKAAKAIDRMRRNFVFDRARYFLPSAATSNFMLLMRARDWVELCQNLLSHPGGEARQLGLMIQEQLALVTPRLIKHARQTEDRTSGIALEAETARTIALNGPAIAERNRPTVTVEANLPVSRFGERIDLALDLSCHPNRYSWIGSTIKRADATFAIDAVAFAELRDLNRHRSGSRFCAFVPTGFYGARDQIPSGTANGSEPLSEAVEFGLAAARRQRELILAGDPSHVYWSLLGTQVPYEHKTQLDKMIYEIELRTGVGAHYRYAEHYRAVHDQLVELVPILKGKILIGSAEPE